METLYDPDVANHLATIERKYYSVIEEGIRKRLRYEPEVETTHRKPLLRPSVLGTAWELRLGPNNRFRVFYRADVAMRRVYVLAIGVKTGNRLTVGEKFDL